MGSDLGLSAAQRHVLLALVEHANPGGSCYPSQSRLSEYTGYSTKTVRRALRALEDVGVIHRSPRYSHGGQTRRRTDLYQLNFPKTESIPDTESTTETEDEIQTGHSVR